MSQPQEQSEAKLLAYIEGDLDADARAEIERHLEANPHHRQMLDDLVRTRDLVRWLPKETAPPELLEQVQSHLERTSLLDENQGRESGRLRINRWPQIRAVAAVLVLASGLGAAIYIALPPRKSGGPPANAVALQRGKDKGTLSDSTTRLEEERERERTSADSKFYAKTKDAGPDGRGATQPADAAESMALGSPRPGGGGGFGGGAGGFGGGGGAAGRGPSTPVLRPAETAEKGIDAEVGLSDVSAATSTPPVRSKVGTEVVKSSDAAALGGDRFRESALAKVNAEQALKRGQASPEVLASIARAEQDILSQTARNAWLVPDVRRALAAADARGVNGAAAPAPAVRPQSPARDADVQLRAAIAPPASKPTAAAATPLFLVVSSPDPDAAGRQIAGYLTVNRIPNETLDGSALAQVNALQERSARYAFNYPRSADGFGAAAAGAPGPAGGTTFEHNATSEGSSAGRAGAAAPRGRSPAERSIQPGSPSGPPAAADTPATPGSTSNLQVGSTTHPTGALASGTRAPSASPAAPAQQGQNREDAGVAAGGGALGDRAKTDAARRAGGFGDASDPYGAVAQRSTESIAPAAAPPVSKLLIARRMTRGQARELQNSVNSPSQAQLAMVFDESGFGRQTQAGETPMVREPGSAPVTSAGATATPVPPPQQPFAASAPPLPAPAASPPAAAAPAPASAGRSMAQHPDSATSQAGSLDQKNAAVREEVEHAAPAPTAVTAPAPAPTAAPAPASPVPPEAAPAPALQSANQSQRDMRAGQPSDKAGVATTGGKPAAEARRPTTTPLASAAAPARPAPPRAAAATLAPSTAPAGQSAGNAVVQARDEDLDQLVDIVIVVQQSPSIPPVAGTTAAAAAAPPTTTAPAAASPVDSTKR